MGITGNQHWISGLKKELRKSPVISSSAFSFILMGLENLVELEFQCPCKPTWNGLFSSAFFIIPAFLAFMLMLISLRCDCCGCCGSSESIESCGYCGCGRSCERFWISMVPAVVWLILVFLDGQYLACAMTDWEGRFVSMDTESLKKWCEPAKEDEKRNNTTQELMLKSQEFFVTSQVWGMVLLGGVCAGLVVYQYVATYKEDKDSKL